MDTGIPQGNRLQYGYRNPICKVSIFQNFLKKINKKHLMKSAPIWISESYMQRKSAPNWILESRKKSAPNWIPESRKKSAPNWIPESRKKSAPNWIPESCR
ncbi:unnamed protein product [Rhizophagus irregularis]|nr:unnamed protein product [Rhizophagus irregularis]